MNRSVPILKCRDIERTVEFYVGSLGAAENWRWQGSQDSANPAYVSVTLLGCELHLSSFAGDGAFGTAVYIYLDEIDALARRLRDAVPDAVEFGPVDQPWGQREVYVRDPDNNTLRFGVPIAVRKSPVDDH